MSKIRIIYLYLVCFVTIWLIVGGFITMTNSVAEYFFPTVSYSSSYNNTSYYENHKIRSLKTAITSLAVVVVSIPIFTYHWKKIEKEGEV